ncbi:MAG: asparagine synthase, partial [Chloroflexi bacterium]|nr:asparagine synthase [Chloroflexota bacterium]
TADANSYLDHFDEVLFQLESISDIHFGPWQIYKAQRDNGVVVTMDGHGGDEALGGYQWYLESALKDSIRQFSIPRTLELVSILRGLDPFPNENFYLKGLQKVIRPGTLQKQSWLRMKPAEAQNPVLAADQQQLKGDALFKKLYIDFHISQLPTVLRNFDRLSMAHGVEVRAPLMDWRLICFAFSLPSSSKIGQGFTKRILRDAVSDILPESVRRRTQKLGFPNLEQAWTSNRSREFMSDIVHSAEFRQSPVWDAEKISKILQAANSDKEGNQLHRVWLHVQAASLMRLFDARKRSFA